MEAHSMKTTSMEEHFKEAQSTKTASKEMFSMEETSMKETSMEANSTEATSMKINAMEERSMEAKSMVTHAMDALPINSTETSLQQIMVPEGYGEASVMPNDKYSSKAKERRETKKESRSRKAATEEKMASRTETRLNGDQHSYEENVLSRERTLSWEHRGDSTIRNREENRMEASYKNGDGPEDGEGICWHHINYKTAEEEKNQPEFLKAKLRRTSFRPADRRRKSSGSDASSR